jgi:hypothetical protein
MALDQTALPSLQTEWDLVVQDRMDQCRPSLPTSDLVVLHLLVKQDLGLVAHPAAQTALLGKMHHLKMVQRVEYILID